MRNTFYQPGAYYAVGTPYFDAKGDPLYRIGVARSTSAVMREALTALESQRQRDCLERKGVAHAFKPSDVCAGGKRLDTCDTANSMIGAAQESAARMTDERPGEGKMWNTLAWLGKTCASCSLTCGVAIETKDALPTGVTRFTNSRPLPGDVVTIRLDV